MVIQFIIRIKFPLSKPIAHIIRNRYGLPTLHLLRKFENTDQKLRKTALDIEFIETCIKHDLVPKFVQFKVANKTLRGSRAYKQCQKKLLTQELTEKKKLQKVHTKRFNQLSDTLRNKLSIIDFAHISSKFLIKNNRLLTRTRLIQEKKLIKLGMQTATETNDPEKVIFNFSSRVLTNHEKSLLAKGLNLSVPPKKLNYADFLQPIETFYSKIVTANEEPMSSQQTDPLNASIKNAAFECLKNYNPKLEQNLNKDEYTALKSLINDKDIIIQKSDKGNSVVLLDKSDYITRMNELLSDSTKFKKLDIEPGQDYNYLINQELRISKSLREIKSSGSMIDSLYNKLNPTGSQPSVLYGLSKVHKPAINNIPKLRPILSAINSPTYNLSQYMNKLLKPFTSNQYTAKDSFTFADDVSKQDTSLYMSSLDVDSLFTNIPLKETVDICCELLFRSQPIVDGLTRDQFEKLLTIATTESLILFNDSYYQQIDGVAMGSPLGPTLANIFLCYHEQQWLDNCPMHFKPSYYRRYVDDIFILLPNAESLNQFKQYMNNQHPNMNFTSETEENNSLPFLDVHVTREQSRFYTSIYRKPTFSGVYTHFSSYLPTVYKESLVSTLLYRAYRICSNWTEIHKETTRIKKLMQGNAYPQQFLDRIISTFYNRINTRESLVKDKQSDPILLVLPHLGNFTKQLERTIKHSLKSNLPDIKVRFIYRASTRLSMIFNFKDKIPQCLSSNILYKFTCSGCNATYIGETTRHAKHRFHEHMGTSALTGKQLKNPNPTTVLDHTKKCQTKAKRDDFQIIGRDNNSEYCLRVKESLLIHKYRPQLNIKSQSVKLELFK